MARGTIARQDKMKIVEFFTAKYSANKLNGTKNNRRFRYFMDCNVAHKRQKTKFRQQMLKFDDKKPVRSYICNIRDIFFDD
jgi:hypothetical protein